MREHQWETALKLVCSSCTCARHNLTQLKILLRLHWTRSIFGEIFPVIDLACPRCKTQPADHIHMFWSCPPFTTFWADIFQAYSIIFNVNFLQTENVPYSVLLMKHTLSGKAHVVIAFTSPLAGRLILLLWKGQTPPRFSRWISDITSFLKPEKIRHTLKGSIQDFERTWSPFLTYYESLQIPLKQTH